MHFRVTFHATNDTTVMTLYFALISDIDIEQEDGKLVNRGKMKK